MLFHETVCENMEDMKGLRWNVAKATEQCLLKEEALELRVSLIKKVFHEILRKDCTEWEVRGQRARQGDRETEDMRNKIREV